MDSSKGEEAVEIVTKEYGKDGVRILHLAKRGNVHTINEFEVCTSLELETDKDFKEGDNTNIIATDSQKNTVYILAKQFGIQTPEEFALRLAKHFIDKYPWVVRSRIQVSKFPWERVVDVSGAAHNHAFVATPVSTRVASASLVRGGSPIISTGIRDMKVLKTTQSSFENFVNDEYRSLHDAKDRVFSTVVTADWTYGSISGLDFDQAFDKVCAIVLDKFAGPAKTGSHSPSVQLTQYQTETEVLKKIPQIVKMSILMPNRHYFPYDFTKFPIPGIQGPGSGTVLHPVDKPSGIIQSTTARGLQSKL